MNHHLPEGFNTLALILVFDALKYQASAESYSFALSALSIISHMALISLSANILTPVALVQIIFSHSLLLSTQNLVGHFCVPVRLNNGLHSGRQNQVNLKAPIMKQGFKCGMIFETPKHL